MRDLENMGIFSLDDAYERMEAVAETAKEAATFLYDGRVICCAGYHIMWPGVAAGWILPSKYVSTAVISFARTVKESITEVMERNNLHRFQTVAMDDALHGRWMKWLGFKREGVMEMHTHDKKNQVMYARVG